MVKINFAAVSTSGNFPAREAGEYEATLIKHEIKAASKASGQPTVTLQWSENDSPNKIIFRTYSLQPKALWSLKRDMIRMGADVEEMNSEEADLDEILQSLYGSVSVIVMDEPRPAVDANDDPILNDDGEQKMYETFKEIQDPTKVTV